MQTAKRLLRYAGIAALVATMMTAFTGLQVHMQLMLSGNDMGVWSALLWASVIWFSCALIAPFAAELARRYPIDRTPGMYRRIALQILIAIAFIVLQATIAATVMQLDPENFGVPATVGRAIVRLLSVEAHWALMSYAVIIAFVHLAISVQRAQAEILAREAARTEAANAQLSALKRQMQPHFLFNALNALVAMLKEGSPPQLFTIRLSDMLRILLQSSERTTATLAEELALVDAYLDIERARLGSRLRTDIQVPPWLCDSQLPSFILQPLVENAITHSISRTLEGGEVQVGARREATDILIEVSNSCAPSIASQGANAGMHITIPNCRRRLALMYGPAARFDAGFIDGNRFRATITVPATIAQMAVPT